MRSFWLTSAATLFIAGAACAQTTTSGPAPTGAPNAPVVTAPGASPGNTGTTATPSSTGQSLPGAAMSNSGGAAKNASGAPNGPTVAPAGKSSGKTQSSATPTGGSATPASTSAAAAPAVHHHYYRSGRAAMFMPANASATTYLDIAMTSVKHHNKATAEEALSRAETQMLNRTVPQGSIAPDTSPGITAIEQARQDVQSGRMKEATAAIQTAMASAGGGEEGTGMAPTSAMVTPTQTAPTPLRPKHSVYSSSTQGLAPTASSTSDSAIVTGGNGANSQKMPGAPATAP